MKADAIREAQQTERLRSEVMATLSHQLRMPLGDPIYGPTIIARRVAADRPTPRQPAKVIVRNDDINGFALTTIAAQSPYRVPGFETLAWMEYHMGQGARTVPGGRTAPDSNMNHVSRSIFDQKKYEGDKDGRRRKDVPIKICRRDS